MATKKNTTQQKTRNYVRASNKNTTSSDSVSQNIRVNVSTSNGVRGTGKESPWSLEVTKKLRKKVGSSKRSSWAAYMNGADPEWLHTRQAKEIAQVFDCYFPAWFIESEPWRPITGSRFKFLRTNVLGLTTEQCAAYLRIHRSTINRWENETVDVPYAAIEALRLLSLTAAQRFSHKHWDGWFINRQSGELICPDNDRLAVKPEEIKGLPGLYNRLSILMLHIAKLEEQVGSLIAENTALRSGDKSRQLAAELEAMQERIGTMLADVGTAEIIEFTPLAPELRRVS